jgi:hypothetical protein
MSTVRRLRVILKINRKSTASVLEKAHAIRAPKNTTPYA